MKISSFQATAFGLVASLLSAIVHGVEYEVGSCADLEDIDDTGMTSLVVTGSFLECESYIRLPIAGDVTLSATVAAVTFSNIGFKILGSLIVDPEVTFTGVVDEPSDGGVMDIATDASVTFLRPAVFIANSVDYSDTTGDITNHRGGAIHNQGTLVFEQCATFYNNDVHTYDSTDAGWGGAIANSPEGFITFKGQLNMTDNAASGFFGGEGGAIYNEGDILVEKESLFFDNIAADGGALFHEETGSIIFNGFANFSDNYAREFTGGAIYSTGGETTFNSGSFFLNNYASGSGDGGYGGGIYLTEEAALTFFGVNTFEKNEAINGGGIFFRNNATITYPEDLSDMVFIDNWAYGDDEDLCDDIYDDDKDECYP